MKKEYHCPTCGNKLEKLDGCGSLSFFCNKCKKLVSSKSTIIKER